MSGQSPSVSPNESRCGAPTLSSFDVDPWRYQCPECETHSIAVRKKQGYAARHLERTDRYQERNDVYVHDFRCEICSAVFDEPYDKKEQKQRLIRHEITRQ